jgi:membrane associated rhomboid family serine protease
MSSRRETPGSEALWYPDLFSLAIAVVVFVTGMTVGSYGIIAHLVGAIVGAIVAFFLSRLLIARYRNQK